MPHNKLSLRRIDRISLVDRGANRDDESGEGAHILLAKMEDDRLPPRQRLAAALAASNHQRKEDTSMTTATATKRDIWESIRKAAREASPDVSEAMAVAVFLETAPGVQMHNAYAEAPGEEPEPPIQKSEEPTLPGVDIARKLVDMAADLAERTGVTKVEAEGAIAKSAEGRALYTQYQAVREGRAG
jgi:hypothetical protein